MPFRFPLPRVWALSGALLASCSPGGGASAGADRPNPAPSPAGAQPAAFAAPSVRTSCPAFRATSGPLPNVAPEQLTLDYWLTELGKHFDLDEVLLSPAQIARLDQGLSVPREDYHSQRDLLLPIDVAELASEVTERRAWAKDKLSTGEYLRASGEKFANSALAGLDAEVAWSAAASELRVALGDTQIHCAPVPDAFFTSALDPRLDRNACSTLRDQEVVRVVAGWPNGMKLVQSASSFGWLAPDARLSEPIPKRLREAFVHGAGLRVSKSPLRAGSGDAARVVEQGVRLPVADAHQEHVLVATAAGFETVPRRGAELTPTRRPLTRRAVLSEAFRYLGTPYGLGDTHDGRDCSRLLLDIFEAFDLRLPRHSAWQAKGGSFWMDIEKLPEAERPLLFDVAAKKGIVLLAFPGHIMLYLGRNDRGEPMVLHALGEYVEPCAGAAGDTSPGAGDTARSETVRPETVRPETVVRVENIGISNLELGRGTSRHALIERITHVTVIGNSPGVELAGIAEQRPAGEARIPPERQCHDSEQAAIYAMPEQPNRDQPLRVVVTLSADPGPAALTLIDPSGKRIRPEVIKLGGPPYGQVASIQKPRQGRWKAVLADGDDVIACQTIPVAAHRPEPDEPNAGPIWPAKYKWNTGNENLYALFVERLFDYPLEDDRTWTSLHPLLRDVDRNLLFDYRSLAEDEEIQFAPDCADLPYVLRSYFAWKLRLPFGYRRCTRGRIGKPPNCDQPGAGDNLMSRLELPGKGGVLQPRADLEAFELFVNNELRSAVHSSSGRTLPEEELSDYYPVPLTRQALQPGTVFADPYGHLLVLAGWVPQPLNGSGILIGADAQPDGTIGQRRFWRGSFLFDPDTTAGGAGFKAFRPRVAVAEPMSVEVARGAERTSVERTGHLEEVDNAELRKSPHYVPFSLQQYQGSADAFYDRMEDLINPRPLEPKTLLFALLDAFGEAVARRVNSIDNLEKWRVEHVADVIDMPEGDAIFLANGPWEDFSTPSRDLRLLISIDTVAGFTGRVRRAPQRFGLASQGLDQKLAELDALLQSELARRTFRYTRSDGSPQELTLADVVKRAAPLEMAYNPNDCPEFRWGAAADSAESSSCRRHAPPEQSAKMASYRHWFATRKRPPQ